jgi:hypothetical protein
VKALAHKVVDQNYLREPNADLHTYLSAGNYIVMTDYGMMEVYKGHSVLNIKRSLEIISKYPRQVVLLKGTQTNIRITQRGQRVLSRLLIDKELTAEFEDFCNQIFQIVPNRLSSDLAILESKGRQANEFYKGRMDFTQMVLDSIGSYRVAFKPEEMKAIRIGKEYDIELLRKMMSHIVSIAARLMKLNGFIVREPKNAKNNYLFRWAIAAYFLVIKWLSEGGYQSLPLGKLQKDIIDMTYVAYATYFDGILSKDKKMNEVYLKSVMLLNNLGT